VLDGLEPTVRVIDNNGAADSLLPAPHSWGRDLIAECRAALESAHSKDDWLPANCFRFFNSMSLNHGLVLDTGSFCTIGEHFWIAAPSRPFHGSNNGRFMGGGIPSAIGAAIGSPNIPLFCAIGDGGMRMYPGEIKLAVSEKLPICFVLMRDGVYSSIACAATQPMSRRAVELPLPSWAAAIAGLGCPSVTVKSVGDFQNAVQKWPGSEPLFIECVFDPDPYMQMTKNLR
jgi:acetolactate synthase-1/2/3 large subunit